MVNMNRRQFFKVTGATLAGSSLALLGAAPGTAMAEVRQFKLARMTETRNTCPYCSVACGLLMYGLGDGSKNARASIMHIEGDPDHPVNRGTLCPKGAALIDFIHSPNRLKFPEYRAPGSDKWVRMSWDEALTRITKLMKADRDAILGGINRVTAIDARSIDAEVDVGHQRAEQNDAVAGLDVSARRFAAHRAFINAEVRGIGFRKH